ncbi:hypothetical protein ACP70R_000033 [Stipagrostis hirtigluma subsp. patula]
MAEAVLLAITKIGIALRDEAIKAAVAKLSEKVTNLTELPKNLEYIGRELSMMNAVIQDMGTTNLNINIVKCWIAELRKLAYHVTDVMDKYSYHTSQLKEGGSLKKFFRRAQYVKAFSEVADEVVKIKGEIEHVRSLKTWFPKLDLIQRDHGSFGRGERCMPEHFKDEELMGIKENRAKMTEWINSSDTDSSQLITVSGMGGLGKTTLVSHVYEREKTRFNFHAWITVSQSYNVPALLRQLLRKFLYMEQGQSAVTESQIDKMGIDLLNEEIKKNIKDKSCLVVLDDVWHHQVYSQLRAAFQNLQACRIIITTRKEPVANLASPERHLKLQPLGASDALNLFYRRAFHNRKDHRCPDELKDVAASIVGKCKGLPLAIVTIGSLLSLRNPTDNAWKQMANQFMSDLAKSDDVQAILNLSYIDMPGNLRNCLLYCSLFPEDYTISRESVLRQWVAEDFAVSTEKNTPEDVAELNLMELISRNMLQVVEYDELGRVGACKMHDIVRDLALSTAAEEKFGSANDRGAMIQMDKDVRRLSSCGWKDSDASGVKFPHLRTLMSIENVTSTSKMLASIFSGSRYLTVLEMQDSEIDEVPESIKNLFNLRYLGLRGTKVKSLPESIEKLSNLQTLDIKQTQIKVLPQGIAKVRKLRHLLADRSVDENQREFRHFIGVQPPRDLQDMVELQTLETVEANDNMADQLDRLMKLQSLWIGNISAAHSDKLFASLSKMPLLSTLLLNASDADEKLCLQAFKPTSEKLHKLIIRGLWDSQKPAWPIFHDHGTNLKYLALSWSGLQDDPLPLLASHAPNLTYLSLNRASSASTLVLATGCFPDLKTLVLKHMNNVNQLRIEEGALKSIESLYVVDMPRLDKVPQGLVWLTPLKKLWLHHLHRDFKDDWLQKGMHEKMPNDLELRL